MKILALFVLFAIVIPDVNGQAGQWTWIHGSSAPNPNASWGVQGVPNPSNVPPALYEACEWTGLDGSFWLYGGVGNPGTYAALWKYNPATNIWTWMKGPNTVNDTGYFGVRGQANSFNHPPSLGWGAPTWVDNDGNLWIYGGAIGGGTSYSALWKYEISTNQWTWMQGPNTVMQPEVYGIQGIPDSLNSPGIRTETSAAWTDDNGDFWLFGGEIHDDMWRYNIASNMWTWMKGSNGIGQPGVYGILGVEDSANSPGGHNAYAHWKDDSGNLWFFGGLHSQFNTMNDLWRFNPITNNWTWMGGSNTSNAIGNCGTMCIGSSANIPRARVENRACWKDPCGNFYFFGGFQDFGGYWSRNDLWMYNPGLNQWMWISGDSAADAHGNWGTLGVPSPLNKPNSKYGSVGWTDNHGNLYLFGGMYSPSYVNRYNDLWKYTIDIDCSNCKYPTGIQGANELPKNFISNSLTNSILTIEKVNFVIREIEIYNMLGKKCLSQSPSTSHEIFSASINVSELSSGIYFIKVKGEDSEYVAKFVKQ
jgi:hypothetical protein